MLARHGFLGIIPLVLATVLGLSSALAFACGGVLDPGDDEGISFSYERALTGRFAAPADTPRVSVEGVPEFGEWALAAAGDSLGGVVVGAFRTAGDGTGDLFVLQLDQLRTGEFVCGTAACHGRVLFGIPGHGGLPPEPAERWFEIVSGSVTVARAGPDRLQGSFSFVARDQGGSGSAELAVEEGSFDLPLTGVRTAVSAVCLAARAAGEEC